MTAFRSAPIFYDNVDQLLSAADLNRLRANVGIVEGLSYREVEAFDSAGALDTFAPGQYTLGGPQTNIRLWKGGLRFRAGMTTLALRGTAANAGATTIRVIFNGGTSSTTISPTATWSLDVPLSGYAVDQVIGIEIRLEGAIPAAARVVVTAIYGTPLVYGDAWPGVPTFGSGGIRFSSSLLGQLGRAAAWLYGRMAVTPYTARRDVRFFNGPFQTPQGGNLHHADYPIWSGGFTRGYTADIIRVYGQIINQDTPQLRGHVYVNGALAGSTSTYGPGTHNYGLAIAYPGGVAVGDRVAVELRGEVVGTGGTRQSKWTVLAARSEAGAGGYPYAALPPQFAYSLPPATTLRDQLNQLATVLSNVKARIDAAPHIWSRAYAMRTWYSQDDNTRGNLDVRARPFFTLRHGSRLWVRGKGVGLAFGPIGIPTNEIGRVFDDHTFARTESLIPADKVNAQTIYLDSIKDLRPGMAYWLTGEVEYAEELL